MTAAVDAYFDNMQQRFRRDVPAIGVRQVPSHIAAFIDDMFTDASVTKPVDDLYIGTHASSDGFLFVRLFHGQVDVLGNPTDVTDFEVLDQAMGPSRPARIHDSLVGYQRGTPPAPDPPPTHSVHIKGCNIGRDRFTPRPPQPIAPFLARLKQVFGSNVNITAPKHFHGLLPENTDTLVVCAGRVLGKPGSPEDAAEMLRLLSGRVHEVVTGVCLFAGGAQHSELVKTVVHFAALSADEIAWYVSTGEPMDKAGAYHVDGRGAVFITGIEGSPSNVAGLPLRTVLELARAAGVDLDWVLR